MNTLVEALNRTAGVWWSYIVPAAWQAALVGLLLLAVVAIGRRWPSPIRFAILAIALLKFAIPPLAAVPSGLFSHFTVESVPHATSADASQDRQQPGRPMPADFRVQELPYSASPAVPPFGSETAEVRVASAEPRCPSPSTKAWLMLAHLAGSLAMFGLIAVQYRRVLRVTRTAEQVTDGPLHQQFASLCRDLGLRRTPRLLLTSEGNQPFSFGTLRASVVLPRSLVRQLSVEQLRATLAHELAHHRRGDLWLNWLQVVLCAVWWFHPVLWLLNRAMRATREDCCDDLLLANALVGDDAYCGVLLQVASAPVRSRCSPLTLTMSDSGHPLGRRFRRIMDSTLRRWPKLPVSAIIALAVLAAVLLPGLRRTSIAADTAAAPSKATEAKPSSHVAENSSPKSKTPLPAAKAKSATLIVSGRVVDAAGKPVAGASVSTLTSDDHPVVAESDAEGNFQLPVDRNRARGLVLVARTADGAKQGFLECDWYLEPFKKTLPPVRLVISPSRSVDVQVVDAAGKPVPDAIVGAVASCRGIATGHSDTRGNCTLRIPTEHPLEDIYALKSGLGMDYLSFPTAYSDTSGDLPPPPDLSRRVILKLTGAKTVRIKLVDPEGRPVEGVGLFPWLFQKPEFGSRNCLNIGGVNDSSARTDSAGVAVFDWIPTWDKQSIVFWPHGGDRWTTNRIEWKPGKDSAVKVVRLQRLVPVRGQVRHADGRPAADVTIETMGNHPDYEPGVGFTRTDDEGRFEIPLPPYQTYLIAVYDNRWTAAPRAGIVVKPDTPIEDIDFQLLKSPTRLHGQLTLGPDKKPWPGQQIRITQFLRDEKSPSLCVIRWATTDAEGRYSFAVGPGNYTVWSSEPTGEQKVTVTDQKELVCNLHAPYKSRGMTTFHVVDQNNPPRPVPQAKVIGISISSLSYDLRATTNDKGWVRVERALGKMMVVAYSKDRKLAGSRTILGEDADVTIPLQPAGAAKGQLIDAPTGKILANRSVRYEVYYHYEIPNNNSGMGGSCLIESVKTDADGRFNITDLVPGLTYKLSVPLPDGSEPAAGHQPDSIGTIAAKSGETVDLDHAKSRGEMLPNEAMAVALANRDPVDKRMAEWADEAKNRNKRTLIIFWTHDASQLLQATTHDDYTKRFADYYVISSQCDREPFDAARATFADKWGLKPSKQPWPLFCILDDDGKTFVVKDTEDFVKNGKADDSLVDAFLKKYAPKKSGK
jgi:beta-lactamase regulating signal transducer with metallopeptidase domain/protocatechuate 3,4-dioxygenase beta subunit